MENFTLVATDKTKIAETQAIVLAAGRGVRMYSGLPKVLHRICGETLISSVIKAAIQTGVKQITVVVGHERNLVEEELKKIRSTFKSELCEIVSVEQSPQNGTGHAVQVALKKLSPKIENVFILPGDSPLLGANELLQLEAEHSKSSAALSFLTFEADDPAGFGRVFRDQLGQVKRIVEAKDCNEQQKSIREVNSSVYLAKLLHLSQAVNKLSNNNQQGEYYLTDIVSSLVERNEKVVAVNLAHTDSLLGANSRDELSMIQENRRQEINKLYMQNGVTLEDSKSTYIDYQVVLAQDIYLGAGTRLYGKTSIGKGSHIEGNSLIRDSRIGENTRVKFSSYIDNAEVGANCEIGPFAHLRPEARLSNNVKVGNFVEIKKAELSEGVKANHLTYIGDAEVGENSNIGAGTITCNYDGQKKHRTVIGDNVFVGSNTCLVAPVNIESGAYIGAGSTITKDVPAGSLGIARAKQSIVKAWVERRRSKATK